MWIQNEAMNLYSSRNVQWSRHLTAQDTNLQMAKYITNLQLIGGFRKNIVVSILILFANLKYIISWNRTHLHIIYKKRWIKEKLNLKDGMDKEDKCYIKLVICLLCGTHLHMQRRFYCFTFKINAISSNWS